MRSKIWSFLAASAALALSFSAAQAANVQPLNPQQCALPAACGDINRAIASINAGAVGLGSASFAGVNFLDNGSVFVNQRGTAEATGATTAGCAVTSYVSDRWCIDTNVTSGAGFGQVVTSSPSPALGFQNSINVYRKTGALTQPVCLMQEIEGARATQLQGAPVILSANIAALAGAPTGMVVSGFIFTGTTADQGLGALRSAVGMTASPALTPAWAGIATNAVSLSATPNASFARFSSAQASIPVGTKSVAVAFCFTPGAEAFGTTDGFSISGMQLERVDPAQTTASAFEFLPQAYDLARAQRFFWQITDPAATVEVPSSCFVTAANTTVKCGVYLPTQMQAVPVTAASGATASFGIVVTAGTAGTCTALNATASSNSVNSIGVTCTTAGTIALGSATPLIGAATVQVLNASADY
jgi:hypothetical protein